MGRSQYKIYESEYPYFITSSFVEGFPVLTDPDVAQLILDSQSFLQNKRKITLFAYVLMENHIHAILSGEDLSEKIRHFKSYTAHKVIRLFEQKKRTRLLRQLKKPNESIRLKAHIKCGRKDFIPNK